MIAHQDLPKRYESNSLKAMEVQENHDLPGLFQPFCSEESKENNYTAHLLQWTEKWIHADPNAFEMIRPDPVIFPYFFLVQNWKISNF